jgi:hypothetical protein
MGATPEETEREIVRLRRDMTAAVAEVERRFRGGLRSVAASEARIGTSRAGENAAARARENPTPLAIIGVIAAGAVAYGIYSLINNRREQQKPQNRLRRGVEQVRAELSGRITEGVETSRHQLERALPQGLLLKLEPESGGYMRVSDAKLEPSAISKQRGQAVVIKRFVWAGFLSVFLAVGTVLARRLADSAWRAMVHEEPPSEKDKEAS